MKIRRRWALPPDVASSTLQPLPPPPHPPTHFHPSSLSSKSSIFLEQDALIGNEQHENFIKGKNETPAKPRKYACNPSSETSADTDSSISSSSSHCGHWLKEDKALPFKKRRIQLDLKIKEQSNTNIGGESKNSNTRRTKRKRTEKIWPDYILQLKWVEQKACHKIGNNSERCNRQNGKGWRCSLPPSAGHTLCDYHLTEQRKKMMKKKKSKTILQSRKAEHGTASAPSNSIAAKKYCILSSDGDLGSDDIFSSSFL